MVFLMHLFMQNNEVKEAKKEIKELQEKLRLVQLEKVSLSTYNTPLTFSINISIEGLSAELSVPTICSCTCYD